MNQYYQEQPGFQFVRPRITWAVQRLIIATGLIFAGQLLLDPLQYGVVPNVIPGLTSHEMYPGGILQVWFGFQPHLFAWGLVWKPFTYMFLHGGLMHLFFNMMWLYFFGPTVERALGTMQFFRFYIFCGAVGVLLTFVPVLLGGAHLSVIGASGATMGVLVAFAMIDPDRQFYLMLLPWPITARGLVFIVVAMDIVRSLSDTNVSVHTHFGGMICGFLYMTFHPAFMRWLRQRQLKQAPRAAKKSAEEPIERVGEAVDNIFKFKGPKDR